MGLIDIETEDDVNRYYAGNLIGLPEGSIYRPMKVLEAGAAQVYLCDAAGNNKIISFDTFKTDCYISMPRAGMIGHDGGAIYSYVNSERQWGRGFVLRRLKLHIFDPSRTRHPDAYTMASKLYNPSYMPFDLAVQQLESGNNMGVPLSRRSALVLHESTPNILLMYKRHLAGHLEEDKIKIFKRYSYILADIGSYLPREAVVIV